MFVENGHNKQLLRDLVIKCNNKKNNRNNHENNTENRDYKNLKKLHWILNISPKTTRVQENRERYCLHVGKTSTTNSLSKKQTKTIPNYKPGVYQLDCLYAMGNILGSQKIGF